MGYERLEMSEDELCVYIDLCLEQLSVVSSDVRREGPHSKANF